MMTIKVRNIIGIIVIIIGFISAPLTNGRLPSILFYWLGFMLLLWPNINYPKASYLLKWARIGLVINILGTLLLVLVSSIATNTALSFNSIVSTFLRVASLLLKPASSIVTRFFPYSQFQMPDGSIQFSISFIRGTITSFFDVLIYLFIGIVLGKFIAARQGKAQ